MNLTTIINNDTAIKESDVSLNATLGGPMMVALP